MPGKLRGELKQGQAFASLEEEVYLNLLKTADRLAYEEHKLLRPRGLSSPLYNVLRILRGAGEAGHSCQDIGARMISHDPDVTRLLDRLEKKGWAERRRDPEDRRVVRAYITSEGLALLRDLDQPLQAAITRLLGHLGKRKLDQLNALLEDARG
jgi:DNA-binding MarR family transcriptional regulator